MFKTMFSLSTRLLPMESSGHASDTHAVNQLHSTIHTVSILEHSKEYVINCNFASWLISSNTLPIRADESVSSNARRGILI